MVFVCLDGLPRPTLPTANGTNPQKNKLIILRKYILELMNSGFWGKGWGEGKLKMQNFKPSQLDTVAELETLLEADVFRSHFGPSFKSLRDQPVSNS